jgi:hypothetical protein
LIGVAQLSISLLTPERDILAWRRAGAFLDIDNPVLQAIARADFHATSCAMRALVQ